MQQNDVSMKNLPEKSVLWIAGNIAAGIIFVKVIINFIGNSFFTTGNIALGSLYAIIVALLVAYMGSKFGVQYVEKRSIINPSKIGAISKITAMFPIAFFLLIVVLEIYLGSIDADSGLTFVDLLATAVFAAAVFFFVKDFLQKSVGKLTQSK